MTTTPRELATDYFEGWRTGDFDRVARTLAEKVTFRGPLGSADGREECLRGLRGMAAMITGIDVQTMITAGDGDQGEVITWYDLRTSGADPLPTANWSRVRDGRIVTIRAAFDPRPLLG
ncbi:ketosteroid isomerase-like protein [Friedmanniella endophytica]|uniref:Ketosteroid isomerase-like protein n=1 Tax=Microlunatus kandeliicorticis TaxID=1759536 RepID=A0A7W3IVK5_9ACTN|nr:nuclear transport factor 2 family protein [Microlunatus kandeliicorticis]MBA8796068.1 ketosteroid isomerase-like protein [Microlunatus kandeliicorticis]